MNTIDFAGLPFEGPLSSSALPDCEGIYAVIGAEDGPRCPVLDIGESENIRERVQNHDRVACWVSQGRYAFAVYRMPGSSKARRMSLESELRDRFNPPCGQR